jgi:hypothetical protein
MIYKIKQKSALTLIRNSNCYVQYTISIAVVKSSAFYININSELMSIYVPAKKLLNLLYLITHDRAQVKLIFYSLILTYRLNSDGSRWNCYIRKDGNFNFKNNPIFVLYITSYVGVHNVDLSEVNTMNIAFDLLRANWVPGVRYHNIYHDGYNGNARIELFFRRYDARIPLRDFQNLGK